MSRYSQNRLALQRVDIRRNTQIQRNRPVELRLNPLEQNNFLKMRPDKKRLQYPKYPVSFDEKWTCLRNLEQIGNRRETSGDRLWRNAFAEFGICQRRDTIGYSLSMRCDIAERSLNGRSPG